MYKIAKVKKEVSHVDDDFAEWNIKRTNARSGVFTFIYRLKKIVDIPWVGITFRVAHHRVSG